ncbi:carotenoid oxygenase family protein [Novosphingobium flavum]|uniref:Dioxygenase n=1 Tax=Novosphingobium aerophilum TaxID=2839843 RepID=A0A7X1F6C3_9SPHN|nr:carotenoid oxygenase family protein [Novosphingobium aerophilum]MBC2651212.1 carotenoid oxygenase family protein [Novosphingobium aerophilum]MBC2660769.1 carotenoid oxygenase family protein [Novosphingobium aerophilum]
MANFPQNPNFTGFNTPSRIEADIVDLVHEGTIPAGLSGAFYRVQPDPQFPPKLGDDIAFNGDGMIARFHFHDGQCDFRQRWAKTDKWKLENAAGKALFGAYRNPLGDDPSVKGAYRSTANTNAFPFAGKLWAMKEDSPALLMDPVTMETIGFEKFGGKMTGETFTSHPKIDPSTGNMVAIGYAASGLCSDDVTYLEVSPDGELVREEWFKVPYYCMMHDFGITEDYLILHIVPSIGSWERLEQGLPHFGFDTTMPVYLGVIPRRAGLKQEDIRWFKRDNCFASHVMNAFQDGSKIHFDIPEAKNNMFPFFPDVHGAPFNGREAMSYLTRWTVDLANNTDEFAAITRLTDTAGEFPRIDDRFTGRPYRHGWMLEMDYARPVELKGGSAGGLLMNCLCHKDLVTGEEQHWWCGPTSSLQEPCFIPRSRDASEGDGWIVQVCNRLEDHRSDLLLFEALDIAKGPVATIQIPIRLRFGLHGNWAGAEAIGLPA